MEKNVEKSRQSDDIVPRWVNAKPSLLRLSALNNDFIGTLFNLREYYLKYPKDLPITIYVQNSNDDMDKELFKNSSEFIDTVEIFKDDILKNIVYEQIKETKNGEKYNMSVQERYEHFSRSIDSAVDLKNSMERKEIKWTDLELEDIRIVIPSKNSANNNNNFNMEALLTGGISKIRNIVEKDQKIILVGPENGKYKSFVEFKNVEKFLEYIGNNAEIIEERLKDAKERQVLREVSVSSNYWKIRESIDTRVNDIMQKMPDSHSPSKIQNVLDVMNKSIVTNQRSEMTNILDYYKKIVIRTSLAEEIKEIEPDIYKNRLAIEKNIQESILEYPSTITLDELENYRNNIVTVNKMDRVRRLESSVLRAQGRLEEPRLDKTKYQKYQEETTKGEQIFESLTRKIAEKNIASNANKSNSNRTR